MQKNADHHTVCIAFYAGWSNKASWQRRKIIVEQTLKALAQGAQARRFNDAVIYVQW